MSIYILTTILLLTATYLYISQRLKSRPPPGLTTAPGPRGLPLIGNTHQLGPYPHRTITKWSRTYGPLFKIRLGWHDWYMLCSPSAVKEVLDKQSAYTSSRAPMPVANEALSGGLRFLFMEYGSLWRRLRGVSHGLLTPKVSDGFKSSQEWEGRALCKEVLMGAVEGKEEGKGTDAVYRAVRRYTVSVIMTSTYGRRIPEWVSEGFFCFIFGLLGACIRLFLIISLFFLHLLFFTISQILISQYFLFGVTSQFPHRELKY